MAVSATSTTGENTYSRMRRLPVLISAVTVVTGDATWEADIAGTIRQAMARFGRLDAVFNNAGLQERRAPLAEQTDAVYTQVFDTNVRALFHAMRHEISALLGSGGGGIVNNTSVSGMRNPNPGLSTLRRLEGRSHLAYASGGNGAPSGIRINAVAPGRVVTDMMLGAGIADMRSAAAGLPLRRMGHPQEVAAAVVWLLSDEAGYVIGHVLATDGGFLAG